ncbi:MAG: L-2-amino-thiazoline-4-carboxylic acid hydrolase, partial [Clostridia bacterium]|nr:L-2-amino-thiazoline-4-carboxylic acid hydrolase [Clostridia bacterium]
QIGRAFFDGITGTATEKISAAIEMFSEPKLGTNDAPIEVKELKRTETEYDFNITRCDYAKLYQDLGVPELGALLVCGVDHPMTEGYNAGVQLDRAQTIMLGADYCPFRYKVNPKD